MRVSPASAPGPDGVMDMAMNAMRAGDRATAETLFRRQLSASPESSVCHYYLAVLAFGEGRAEAALAEVAEAIRLDPLLAEAHGLRGDILQNFESWADAAASYEKALELKPNLSRVRFKLAQIRQRLGAYSEACRDYALAASLQPEFKEAHFHRGDLLYRLGDLPGAVASLDMALGIDPDDAAALALWLRCRRELCDWDGADEAESRFIGLISDKAAEAFPPDVLLGLPLTAEQDLACHRRWSERGQPAEPLPPSAPSGKSKVTLGYVSAFSSNGDLQTLLRWHDQERFDIIVYSLCGGDGGLAAVDLSGLSDLQAAQRIHADKVDILVDLAGTAADARPGILAFHPGRVHARFPGLGAGAGCRQIDLLFGDPVVVPGDRQEVYAKDVASLPVSALLAERRPPSALPMPGRTHCGLPEEGLVFACFGETRWFTAEMFALWMDLLVAVPGSCLWLGDAAPVVRDNLWRAAGRSGVAAGRIVFAPAAGAEEHAARLRQADLCFDTGPVSGRRAVEDALWAGVPVLTWAGETMAGRLGASLVTAHGLGELVCRSLDELGALALALAASPQRLAGLRRKVLLQRLTSPVFDAKAFVGRYENLLSQVAGTASLIQFNAVLNRAAALRAEGRAEEAVLAFRQALAVDPLRPEAYNNLANTLAGLRRFDEALAAYRQALTLRPELAEIRFNMGALLLSRELPEEAAEAFRQVAQALPDNPEVHQALGTALMRLEAYGEAEAAYRQAVRLRPNSIGILANLGAALNSLGRTSEAITILHSALALEPGHAKSLNNLGYALEGLGRSAEAAAAYGQAVASQPDFAEAWNNLANSLKRIGRYDEAIAAYARALAIKPDYADSCFNLGNLYEKTGRQQEAIAAYGQALTILPTASRARMARLHQRMQICDWTDLQADQDAVLGAVRAGEKGVSPFALLSLDSTPKDQLAAAGQYARQVVAHPLPPMVAGERAAGKIRLGYMSADFQQHPVAFLAAELYERHDRERFEVIAYSYGPDDGGPMRQRLRKAFDRFTDIRALPNDEAAALIRADGIDILVDLTGYTQDARTSILASRPAPIQVNFLGFPGTMGAGFMDYIIVDPTVAPMGEQAFFSERLVQLPHCYQPNDRKRQIAASAPSRAELGLPGDGLVFCCFNNTYKITPKIFSVWMTLLAEVPGSVLWLLEANAQVRKNLGREAAARGIAPERLVFAPRVGLPDHLARHRRADLFLDTLPYNAHTTASDALWTGLPLVTLIGATFAGRVAASLLTAMGLPELVTHSLRDYQALALALAGDPGRLAALRARLEENRDTQPLFDIKGYARHIEAAYGKMFETWRAGRPPEGFAVPRVRGHQP